MATWHDNILAVKEKNNMTKKKKKDEEKVSPIKLHRDKGTGRITPTSIKSDLIESEVINMVYDGYSFNEIHRTLIEMGYKKPSADVILKKVRLSLEKYLDKEKQKLVNQNILILQRITRNCMESGRYREAIAAISELNKILHAYDIKTEVNINNYGFSFDVGQVEELQEPIENIEDAEIVDE